MGCGQPQNPGNHAHVPEFRETPLFISVSVLFTKAHTMLVIQPSVESTAAARGIRTGAEPLPVVQANVKSTAAAWDDVYLVPTTAVKHSSKLLAGGPGACTQ